MQALGRIIAAPFFYPDLRKILRVFSLKNDKKLLLLQALLDRLFSCLHSSKDATDTCHTEETQSTAPVNPKNAWN